MGASDIFGTGRFTRYHVELQVRERLTGGIPKDANAIKQWLKSRLDLDDRAIVELANETQAAMMSEGDERPSADALLDALVEKVEAGNGFKRVDGQLIYEGRCMKAAIKEASNVAFPGTTWPGKPTKTNAQGKETELVKKGLMRFLAERVFVEDDTISLGVSEPSWTEQRIKHIITREGPRSAINVVDVVEKPHLSFTVKVLDDCLNKAVWAGIWETLEEIGIGADRARSDGKFDLLRWERIPG